MFMQFQSVRGGRRALAGQNRAPLSRRKMGMSTLAVKPRDRVRCRAKAGDSGLAEPKARAPAGSFLKPDKELAGGHRDYGSGRATTLGHTINDLRQERARSLRRGVAGKSHLKDFHLDR